MPAKVNPLTLEKWTPADDETLQSESAFESRMDALCREVGDRGRADTTDTSLVSVRVATALAPAAVEPEAELEDSESAMAADLLNELVSSSLHCCRSVPCRRAWILRGLMLRWMLTTASRH